MRVIGDAFVDPTLTVPARGVVQTDDPGGDARRTLLVMPAVCAGDITVVKVVVAISGGAGGLNSHLLALDAAGALLAVIEAHLLTARRTAAASVLAARALGAGQARRLAVLGAGRQARAHVDAFASAMTLDTLTVWARRTSAAEDLAAYARDRVGSVRVAASPADAVRGAQVVSCVTASTEPLIGGATIGSGVHVDLVGGFRPSMREADDGLIVRAGVVIDTPAALVEAGDLTGPIAAGVLSSADAVLLGDILSGRAAVPPGEITVFKSVGHAGEDLVAARLLLTRAGLLRVRGDDSRQHRGEEKLGPGC